MIKTYISGKQTDSSRIIEIEKEKAHSWISLIAPTEDEVKFVSEKFGLERHTLDDMLDYESVPHVEKELKEGYIFFILRTPVVLEDKGLVTIPLGIIFLTKKNIVITVCKHDNFAITKLSTRPPKSFTTKNKVIFFRQLNRKVLNSYMSELHKIEQEIRAVEDSIKDALENKEIALLLSKQNTLVYFKTSMVGNKSVLTKISLGKIIPLNDEEKDLLEDAIIDINEAQQLISIYSEIISHTMSAYASIVSNNLSFILKLLAIVTLAISVPTMLFSFYGMNVNLPFQQDPIVVIYLILIALGVIGLILLVFKKKKWF